MNPYEGGEIYTVQGAQVPIDQLRKFYSSKFEEQEENEEQEELETFGYHINSTK